MYTYTHKQVLMLVTLPAGKAGFWVRWVSHKPGTISCIYLTLICLCMCVYIFNFTLYLYVGFFWVRWVRSQEPCIASHILISYHIMSLCYIHRYIILHPHPRAHHQHIHEHTHTPTLKHKPTPTKKTGRRALRPRRPLPPQPRPAGVGRRHPPLARQREQRTYVVLGGGVGKKISRITTYLTQRTTPQAPIKFHTTPAMPVATAHGLLAWLALVALGLTALDSVRRRAWEVFKVRVFFCLF